MVKMSEDLNLPASLQRLEITPDRSDSSKIKLNNPFSVFGRESENPPECFLESLSLNSVCSKGNCQCNTKDKKNSKTLWGIRKTSPFRMKPIELRRLRRADKLLRAPMLKLESNDRLSNGDHSTTLDASNSKSDVTAPEESCVARLQGSARFLLREPILRIIPPRPSVISSSTRWGTQEGTTQHSGSQQSRPAAAMCAVQARNPAPDETSIEELASYFDLLVHIPKKMSDMAEMMYI